MAVNPIMPVAPPRKKGLLGKIGGVLGTVLGGAVGGLTGGLPGASLGASLGGKVGGTVGGLAQGGGGGQPQGPSIIDSAVKKDPNLQIGVLQEGRRALKELPIPGPQHEESDKLFNDAIEAIRRRMNIGG